jgi:hypothetical protein
MSRHTLNLSRIDLKSLAAILRITIGEAMACFAFGRKCLAVLLG